MAKKKKGIASKEFTWAGKKVLDKTVTKDMGFSILKTVINKMPLPTVKCPEFEDLQYMESQEFYRLKEVLKYCWKVEDNFAAGVFTHEKKHLQRYKDLFENFMNFMIVLSESDSFYRHRMMYFLMMSRSDMLRNHYFRLIREYGLDEAWDGRVLNIKLSPDSFFRDGVNVKSREMSGIFSHLEPEMKKRGVIPLGPDDPRAKKRPKKDKKV